MEDKARLRLLYNAAVISGIFCLLVSLLLLLNYLQFSTREPLESQAMEILLEKLSEDPGNEALKEDIRNLDMLARKAYFNSQWQIRTGSYLLLFGAIVFAFSLRYYHSLKSGITEPEDEKGLFRGGLLTQRWILGTGVVLILSALGTSYLTVNHLDEYGLPAGPATADQASPREEGIEVIDLAAGGTGSAEQASRQTVPEQTALEEKTASEGPEQEEAAETAAAQDKPPAEQDEPPGRSPAAETASGLLNRESILAQHNSFRGAWGNGVSAQAGLPVDWDGESGRSVAWKKEVPKPGYNSPVIWNEKLFISGADKAAQVVYCYNRHTGEMIWEAESGEIPGSPAEKPRVTDDTGLAASGLATDGRGVFAIFATGDVVCFGMDGKRLWARNLGTPDNHYGHSSSLLVWDGKLFIQYDTNRGGRVLALNVLTGETLWDTRRSTGISWASPLLVEHKGSFQIVLSADPLVAGYDIRTGEELWSVNCMMGEVGPSPAYSGGLVFAANEYAVLAAIDLDNPTETLWETDEYLPEVASPVASEGLLYIATSYGVLACYDTRTGEKYWEQEYGNGFYSSPVIADGKVYATDMRGVTHICALSKEFRPEGEPALGEKVYSTPAFAGGKLYIRGEKHLYCIGK